MIDVLDGFLTDQQATELEEHAQTCGYARTHVSDVRSNRDSLRFVHHFDLELFDRLDVMQKVRDVVGDMLLADAYINASDCNTLTLSHIDSTDPDDVTVLIYLNKTWNIDDHGATMFFRGFGDDEVIKTVFPKPKRAVIFPSNLWHMAGIPSPEAPVRYTLAIKLKANK